MMACTAAGRGRVMAWSAALGILCAVLTSVCTDEVRDADLSFTSNSSFHTDMVGSDLDAARKQEIKDQLQPKLAYVFGNITGFIGVAVTDISINEKDSILVTSWTVRLNRNDPKFVNSTPEEIGNIVRPELEAVSQLYRDAIVIDTSKHERPQNTGSGDNNNLALGLGLGLGLGLPVLAVVVLVAVLVTKRRERQSRQPAKSVSDVSSSHYMGGSSKMDQSDYRHTITGGFIPSVSGKSVPSSVSGSTDYIIPVNYDTLSSTATSETSRTYVDLSDLCSEHSCK